MKKLLYIIDDINYNSGAKAVTRLQMKKLQQRVRDLPFVIG